MTWKQPSFEEEAWRSENDRQYEPDLSQSPIHTIATDGTIDLLERIKSIYKRILDEPKLSEIIKPIDEGIATLKEAGFNQQDNQ